MEENAPTLPMNQPSRQSRILWEARRRPVSCTAVCRLRMDCARSRARRGRSRPCTLHLPGRSDETLGSGIYERA